MAVFHSTQYGPRFGEDLQIIHNRGIDSFANSYKLPYGMTICLHIRLKNTNIEANDLAFS